MSATLEVFNAVGLRIDKFEPVRAESALIHGLEATAGLTRWIDGGTLLGVERDGSFIGHDTDVDIAVSLTTDQALDLQLPDSDLVRTIRWNHLPMQHAYLANDTIVDLYFYYSDVDPGYLVNVNTEGVLRIPTDLVLPIDERFSWHGHNLPVPNARQEYLAWSYGSSWTTPAVAKVDWAQEHAHLDSPELVESWKLSATHKRLATLVAEADLGRKDAIAARDAALAKRDRALVQRDAAITRRRKAISQRDQARLSASRARQRLTAIQSSRAWRMVSTYYSARDHIWRSGKPMEV